LRIRAEEREWKYAKPPFTQRDVILSSPTYGEGMKRTLTILSRIINKDSKGEVPFVDGRE